MKTETPREIAERVVERMFTNGSKEKATRLVLVLEERTGEAKIETAANLGGWSRGPLVDFIEDAIKAERERAAKIAETEAGKRCMRHQKTGKGVCGYDIAASIRGSKD